MDTMFEVEQSEQTPATTTRARKPRKSRNAAKTASGEPGGTVEIQIGAEAENDGQAATSTRKRRGSKLTGANVEQLVAQGSALAVMFGAGDHWLIAPDEVKPWSKDAAELLNKIPSKYITATASFNGYVVVGLGIYATMKPRLERSRQLAEEAARKERDARMMAGPVVANASEFGA